MCGIFGRMQLSQGPLNFALCCAQTDTLRHRGPDSSGYFGADSFTGRFGLVHDRQSPEDNPNLLSHNWDIFLGHRRLAILDLSPKAAQPMGDPTGRYWITFNGEIYNFAEIKHELQKLGVVFRSERSDTEVLLMAFVTWGVGSLARLRGMFAFVILDLLEKRFFLARDRLGKKPLYYWASPESFQFSSELKAIIKDSSVSRQIDPVALGQYMLYGYIPAPRTIYQGIAKLPPGHCAWVDLARPHLISLKRYWELPEMSAKSSDSAWLEEFNAEFSEAVRLRLISDVPLGAFASGGLDSTLVIRQMHQVSREPVRTFSIGFPEEACNELPWARQVARRYQTQHVEEVVRPDALALLPYLVRQFDEPFADSSAVPTWIVSEMARRHVTVALSGDGGDELFAGYTRYHNAQKIQRLMNCLPQWAHRPFLKTLGKIWPDSWKGKNFLDRAGNSPGNLYRAIMAREANVALLNADIRRALVDSPETHAFFEHLLAVGPQDQVSRLQFVDLHTYLPEDILVKTDRTSMAASLELRCPLLDHRVVEPAARMPQSLKYRNGDLKYIIKQILLPEMGAEFVYRKKNGFQVPLRQWFRGEMRDFLKEQLLGGGNSFFDLCDQTAITGFVYRFLRGQMDLSEDLWRLVVLAEWHRQVHQKVGYDEKAGPALS